MRNQKHLDRNELQIYSDGVRRHRLNKGETLFRRTRYQHGSVEREERRKGPAVWVYRWWEEDINGKLVHRKAQVGDVKKYPTESAAHSAADALRLTINNRCEHRNLRRTTINTLWEHYSQEELPLKALSTQDAYIIYAKNWIVPRWGNLPLEQVKTVEVERWLRAIGVADGTKAKIKCVMSALFSHAVRWEFCGHNPISSGIPVGTGGKRGPSTGVRISAKRQRSPLVLSSEQVKLGLAELEFRDQLLVFLEGALGIRQGELGALRWLSCDFDNMSISVQHSYYWRRGGNLKSTKTEASAKLLPMHPSLKHSLQEWRSQSLYNKPEDFVFPSERLQGSKLVRSSFSFEEENTARIQTNRNHWSGLAHVSTFRRNDARGDGRTSTHHPRLLAAQQPSRHEQVSAGDIEDQTLGTRQIGRRYFADGYFAEDKPNSMSAVWNRSGTGPFSFGAYRPLTSPDLLDVRVASA